MKLPEVFMLGLLAFTIACSRTPDANRRNGEAAEMPSTSNVRHAQTEKGVLRIEPEMLRDLKLTTAPVEQRPGGDEFASGQQILSGVVE